MQDDPNWSIYCVLLLFCGEKVLLFLWITLSLQKISVNICYRVYLIYVGSVADDRKSFSTFTAKQKQYTVLTSGINRYWAMAWAWTDLHLARLVAINWNVHVLWHYQCSG